MKRIAIFASGSGSNAEKIIEKLAPFADVEVSFILCNNYKAGVIERARRLKIPVLLFDRTTFYDTHKIAQILQNQQVDLIVLAGFMWLIPGYLVEAFPDKIVNIHPALLPKFGGKGMYGQHVHQAVIAAQEVQSGITIHFVNQQYDKGQIIFQASCVVSDTDTPESLEVKIHALEHAHYPEVVRQLIFNETTENVHQSKTNKL